MIKKKRAKFGDVEFSVISSEEVSRGSTITDKPVEEGENVADHIKTGPISFAISGVCTFPDAGKKLDKLEAYWKKGKTMTYVGRNVYSDMGIESFRSTHDNQNVDGFAFSMTLKQVRIAKKTVTYVKLPIDSTQVQRLKNKGKKQTTKTKKDAKVSVLDKVKASNYKAGTKG